MTGSTAARGIVRRCAIALAFLSSPCAAAAAGGGIEYEVKATYLFKFAPFVEWPASAYPSATSPFNLCVVGDDAVAALVTQAAAGQSVGTRPIVVRHLAEATPDTGCEVMYIAGSDAQPVAEAVAVEKNAPVLTVTDEAAHPSDRAIISFVIADNHVRFDIDDAAAAQAGLVISSKLLGLAHSVKPRAGAPHP